MADPADSPHKKTKLEQADTTAPYSDRAEDPTATAILRKKKKPNVCSLEVDVADVAELDR